MSRAVACLLLTAVLHAACVAATTYGVYSYYAGTGCEGTPYAVYAYEDAECLDTECAAYDGSASGTTIEKMTVDCTTDYISATRDKFSSTKYIIEVGFNEESCSTLYYAYGVPALGNCEGSFKENDSFYIIGSLNSNGSAAIKYYNDSQCATTETGVDSASKETLATHSCDANWVKWYTSNDDDASSSGSATQEDSSGLSTGAIIGIICGCVVVLLLVIGGALLYRRRRRAQGKAGGQWTATLPSGDLTALEAAMSGQSGLWNDDVITAKRIPRDKRSLDTNGRKMADATLLQKITAGEVHVEFSASNPKALVELGYACVSVDPADRPSSAEALYRLQVILQELALKPTTMDFGHENGATAAVGVVIKSNAPLLWMTSGVLLEEKNEFKADVLGPCRTHPMP
ncbi:hypothetical protein PRIC1_014339 [Phytophthora ramorum]